MRHELGHVLGLVHEEDRFKEMGLRRGDEIKALMSYRKRGGELRVRQYVPGAFVEWVEDSHSVMREIIPTLDERNVPNPFFRLTDKDKQLVALLYGRPGTVAANGSLAQEEGDGVDLSDLLDQH